MDLSRMEKQRRKLLRNFTMLLNCNASGDTQSEGRSITRNVVYNEGIIELAFNAGNLGEIFEIIQGDPNGVHRVLFNSGDFKTKGSK